MSVLPPENIHAPFIILSNSIYARRSDGSYYPGSVEGKCDDLYTVKYCDGATEQLREENLTWLGFWGLPPLCWPKTPVIQPVASSWEAFESQALYLREGQGDAAPTSEAHTCNTQGKRSESEPDLSKSPLLTPNQTACRQTRSSVIRLNSNMLTKDGNLEAFCTNFTDTNDQEFPSRTKESPDCERDSEETLRSTAGGVHGLQNTIENSGDFQRNQELDATYENEPIYRYYLERRKKAAERGIGRDHTSLEETDYFNKDFYKPSYMLENSHNFGSPFPFFNQQLGMTLFRASPHAVIPTSFRLQLKARRKDEKKKCRKVYGIENRHFWCTQCKWKKACTRFTTGSKIISNGFI